MSYELILALISCIAILLVGVVIPIIKKKPHIWLAALFAVHLIEQICNFLDLHGYGPKKYEFVRKVLLLLNPKLSNQQIETIIETLVKKMNALKEA